MCLHVHLTCQNNGPESLMEHQAFCFIPFLPRTHPTNSVLEASTTKSSQVINCVNVEFMSHISETCLLP